MQCLSAKEVAALLGLSQRTVTRMLRAGEIAGFKVNDKLWRTTAAKVADYQERGFRRYRTEDSPSRAS